MFTTILSEWNLLWVLLYSFEIVDMRSKDGPIDVKSHNEYNPILTIAYFGWCKWSFCGVERVSSLERGPFYEYEQGF